MFNTVPDVLTVSQVTGSQNICQYQLADISLEGLSTVSLADGTKISTDSEGQMRQVQYASGIVVRRHVKYVLVRSKEAGFLFGDCSGRWYPID